MWIAQLSNKEIIKESAQDSWRKLREYCKTNNLKIAEIVCGGRHIDMKNVLYYYVLFDQTTFLRTGHTSLKKCIGRIKNNIDKEYIEWFLPNGQHMYNEVKTPIRPFISEIWIPTVNLIN